jgi:uncharacterized protein YecE (DUF72 family)
VFYPEDMRPADQLHFYSRHLGTLELNVTFYRQVKEATFRKWYEIVPEEFLFSVKMSRFITHIKRLKADDENIQRFLSGAAALGDKLGVILIQLPPAMKYDGPLVNEFLGRLDTAYRYTVEARNKSFLCDEFFALLQERGIAWCIADSAGRFPYCEEVTTEFIYIRLHGSDLLYSSDYSDAELVAWKDRITAWDKETFVYFDNDFQGYAAKNALTLKSMLDV